jgi:endo-1,4-beta-xylanase
MSELYHKQWDDPEIKERIDFGIENYRKGWCKITFIDSLNNPVSNLNVKVQQLTHEFLFGSNLFCLGLFEKEGENNKYEKSFLQLFNYAIVPFFWNDLEPKQGLLRYEKDSPFIWRRVPPDAVVDFCNNHNITMKGHTLVWDNKRYSNPDWTPKDADKMEPILRKRIESIADRYGNDILYWDVVNEALRTKPHVVLPNDYAFKSFDIAEKYFPPDRKFVINETTNIWFEYAKEYSPFYLLCENLIIRGAKIDAIGLQFHITGEKFISEVKNGESLTPSLLFEVLDQYADLGKPIQITEVTIPAFDNKKQDLIDQAILLKNFYRLWFSHPMIENIVYWTHADTATSPTAKYMNGGLLDKDFNKKDSYKILDDLINNEWRTKIFLDSGTSNLVKFKGFYGKYKLIIERNGITNERVIDLTKTGDNNFIIKI